jgi:DNA topoisomerase-1
MASTQTEIRRLMKTLGLVNTARSALAITRKARGRHYDFFKADGSKITDAATIDRLNKLAVPPAYEDVRYAANARGHLQAIGRDAAGRIQYRYHPDWDGLREQRKAKRLAVMAESLPKLKRALARDLAAEEPTKALALACCVELVSHTAIRAGGERYESISGSRGATTLLKSNAKCIDGAITLSFRGKGGKQVEKGAKSPRLCRALDILRKVPGRYLFQYRAGDGSVCRLRAGDVNAYLKDVSSCDITLKDFRTLLASSLVSAKLAALDPSPSPSGRKRQVKEAIASAAEELANTPTVCRKSYVHDSVVEAFESGKLKRLKAKAATKIDLLVAVVSRAA